MKTIKRNILLNPGPATTTDTVKFAQVVPDICPREEEFGNIMEYISSELTELAGVSTDEYSSVLFGGSGTAAIEAVISSITDENDCLLIINNGAYGERMCQIAKTYNINFVEYKSSALEPIDIYDLESVIKKEKLSYLLVVHSETTTGLLNDVQLLGALCEKHGIELVVDAMSSFAAIEINLKKMNIKYLIASSNKNLQGMAGVSFVIANKYSLEKIKHKTSKSYYLDLYAQYKYFSETKQTRFTPPVQAMYALKQAIEETKSETIEARGKRYAGNWETLIKGLEELGLAYIVDKKYHSKIVTSIVEPDLSRYCFSDMHAFFKERGFTIYPGKIGDMNTFRIANIGAIDKNDMTEFLEHLNSYLISLQD